MKIYDVIILGAGASGLMCAAHLNKRLDVAIIDTNTKVAKKLKISGGGKCNITNVDVSLDNFDGDKELLKSVFERFGQKDLLEFLDKHNVKPVLRKNRYYFCKDSSDEIINVLKKLTKKHRFILDAEILKLSKDDELFTIDTKKGVFKSKKVVVATGGKSFATLGASDIGLKIAKSFDISFKEFSPALVGLTVQKEQFWMKKLSGLSCYVHIKVDGKILKEDMLFAHKGISGPAVLSASLYWKKGKISVDFLPNKDVLELTKNTKKLISSAIPLPKRLCVEILKALGLKDIECKKLTKEAKEKLKLIHNYEFAPAGNFGFTKAEVCRGGIDSKELQYNSLQSKSVKGLYFIGEVVDITGELGGYNFQWAFSSGVICAKNV
jgi:predicted Rossmann fold flavoprotein